MEDNIYTLKRLCDELNHPRQKIRRRLKKLEIKAINEDNRIYKNDPLEYDCQAFLKLAEEFDIKVSDVECTASVQHRTTENNEKDKLIKVLEEQLKEANKSRTNLEKLLDQQQQLNLISNKKLEALKLELEDPEQKNIGQEKKKKWYDFFRRN